MKYLLLFLPFLSFGQSKEPMFSFLDAQMARYKDMAFQIWDFAELGYQEYKSSKLLADYLESQGFQIERGVANIPTAFVASYGETGPTIGILAEYDALPGLSQKPIVFKETAGQKAGHACGHHLFGVGSVAAAVAVKGWLIENQIPGRVKLFGTPAEEGGSGKVYMTREGLFKEVDVMLHWHPSDANSVDIASSLANKTGKFRFYGRSAHAALSPERGRSALDGVEAMTHMINMLREHVPSDARIHYVITNGGKAPNVVPDFAEVYLYIRHPSREVVKETWDWAEQIAQAAAMGTQTKVEWEIIGGVYDLLPNKVLSQVMHENMQSIGGFILEKEEVEFAKNIQSTEGMSSKSLEMTNVIQPIQEIVGGASTDVGDVSWNVPTVGCRTATWVPGTAAHSWQAVSCGRTDIAIKGMLLASKTLAATAVDLFLKNSLITDSKSEFFDRLPTNFNYQPLLGDRAPALNYRD